MTVVGLKSSTSSKAYFKQKINKSCRDQITTHYWLAITKFPLFSCQISTWFQTSNTLSAPLIVIRYSDNIIFSLITPNVYRKVKILMKKDFCLLSAHIFQIDKYILHPKIIFRKQAIQVLKYYCDLYQKSKYPCTS